MTLDEFRAGITAPCERWLRRQRAEMAELATAIGPAMRAIKAEADHVRRREMVQIVEAEFTRVSAAMDELGEMIASGLVSSDVPPVPSLHLIIIEEPEGADTDAAKVPA